MKRWTLLALLMISLTLPACGKKNASPTETAGGGGGGGGKPAATPEEAISIFAESARTANLERAKDVLVLAMVEILEESEKYAAKDKAFNELLDSKFGKAQPPKKPEKSLKEQMQETKSVEILNKKEVHKGLVQLKVKTKRVRDGKEETREEEMLAHHDGKGWRLIPGQGKMEFKEGEDINVKLRKEAEPFRKFMSAMSKGIDDATKQINEGKIKSRQEAEQVKAKALFGGE